MPIDELCYFCCSSCVVLWFFFYVGASTFLSFHAIASLLAWRSNLNKLKKLLLNFILINEKFNNWVVKIGCKNRLLLYMQEPP